MEHKLAVLEDILDAMGTVGVGYSGGVDSTFLAAVCARALPEHAMLFHLETPLAATPERASFEQAAASFGLPVISLPFDALAEPRVAANPADRCYHCKRAGFARIIEAARQRGCDVVVDGSNADDEGDYRPGMRALSELGVRSPLMEAGFSKAEERELLRAWGYDVWSLPAGACLATRIPCDEALSAEKLACVRACEGYLHEMGLEQVRVRLAAGVAQVTASPQDLDRLRAAGGQDERSCGVALPAHILATLQELGPTQVEPIALPYVHGATSMRT